ncbi:MAG: hypothetical protein ACODAF_08720, partial [Actinomycetota bacterium]
DVNNAQATMDAAQLDKTTFGSSGWTELVAGLTSVQFTLAGFWQSADEDAVDPDSFAALGTADLVTTFGPFDTEATATTDPANAYLMRNLGGTYELGGEVGVVAPFRLAMAGSNGVGVRRGHVVKAKGDVSSTGQVGQTLDTTSGGTDDLHVTFHVFSAGTSITVDLETDDNDSFSSPTSLATIGPLTARGGVWTTVSSATYEQYLRLNVTAITGTFSVAAALAIG